MCMDPSVELAKDAIFLPICIAARRIVEVTAVPRTPPVLRLKERIAVASPRSRSPDAHCTMVCAAGIVEPSPAPIRSITAAMRAEPAWSTASSTAKPTVTVASPYNIALRGFPVEEIRKPVIVETSTCAAVSGIRRSPEVLTLTPSSA